MRLSLAMKALICGCFLVATISSFAQAVPTAKVKSIPLIVGFGFNNYDTGFVDARRWGTTGWVDWGFRFGPPALHAFGLQAELRDIRWGGSSSQPFDLKEDTAMGGLTYTWRHFDSFSPYGKFLAGAGHIDFNLPPRFVFREHTTKKAIAFGGGADYHVYKHLWVRGDYEYQLWGKMLGYRPEPNGFTIGAAYNFRRYHPHNY